MSSISRDRGTIYIADDVAKDLDQENITAEEEIYRRAAWLGIVAGLRSMLPEALLTWSAEQPSPSLKTLTALLAAGEIVGDKLPFTPSRLKSGSLIARLTVGALAGGLLCRRYQQSPIQGAIRGAIGAGLGSVAGYAYRSVAADLTGVPDIVWALVEDSIAIGLGAKATDLKLSTFTRK